VAKQTPPQSDHGGAGCPVFRSTLSAKGFKDPLLLMLFMKDGYADFLEGAIIEVNSTGIDLATLRLKIELG
jgi:hypothetical protein